MKKIIIEKEFLEIEYLDKKKSCEKIAKEIGCSTENIRRNLIKFGIERRDNTKKPELSKKFLNREYTNKKKKYHEISKETGISENKVRRSLIYYGIKIRRKNNQNPNINKKLLMGEHINKGKSCKEIAENTGLSENGIRQRLIKFGIKRDPNKWTKIRRKNHQKLMKRLYDEGKINPTKNLGDYAKKGVHKGENSPNFGSVTTRKTKRIQSAVKKGKPSYERTENHKKLMSEMIIEKMKDPEMRDRILKKAFEGLKKRPTSFEQKIISLCTKYRLPFIYTGDGRIMIGRKNPDFIDEKDKLIIEVFLNYFKIRDFGSVENYIKERGKYFKERGYETIFIREEEVMAENWEEICLNKIRREI